MKNLLITFVFVLGCFTVGAFSQCRLPMIPPPTISDGRLMAWTLGALEFNIQNEPDFTLKNEQDSINNLQIVRGEIRFKGVPFAPPARIKAPVRVYQGFFNENDSFGTRRWVVVVPTTQTVGRLLLLDLSTCKSKFVFVGAKQIGRLVWKNENNFVVCDSNRSSYAQVNALTSGVRQGVSSAQTNPCGYYIPVAGPNPIPIRVGDRWGFSDANKRLLVEARYDSASPFSDGLAVVNRGPKCGYIDKKGIEVIPIMYDTCYNFADGAAKVEIRGESYNGWMLINQFGKMLDLVSQAQDDFSEGLSVEIFGKWAKNPNGKAVVSLNGYVFEDSYSEGLACVRDGKKGTASGNGFVDKTGHLVFWSPYNCRDGFYSGLASMRTNSGDVRYGFIDKKGKVVIPFKYKNSLPFMGDFAIVQDQDGWMTIDHKGQKIASLNFDDFGPPHDGLIPVGKDGKWGFADKTGKIIIALKYDNAGFIGGLPLVSLNGKTFFLGKDGTEFYIPK